MKYLLSLQFVLFFFSSIALAQSLVHLDLEKSILASVTGEERRALRAIVKNNGAIVDMQASGLHHTKSFMEETGARLGEVIAEKYGRSHHFETEIFLIENPEVNAYVYQAHRFTERYSQSYVFLTTGLLEATFNTQIKGALAEIVNKSPEMRAWAIAGFIAHEMSHPVDNINNEDYQSRDRASSHMSEFVSDLSPVEYLKAAGMPPEAMITSLAILAANEPKDANVYQNLLKAVEASMSSHPTTNLRLSLVNGAVTLQRINQGEAQIIPTRADLGMIEKEVRSFLKLERNASSLDISVFRSSTNASELIEMFVAFLKEPTVLDIKYQDYLLVLDVLANKIHEEGRTSDIDLGLTYLFETLISNQQMRKKINSNLSMSETDLVKERFNFLADSKDSMEILTKKVTSIPQWKGSSGNATFRELSRILPTQLLLKILPRQ